MKTSEFIKYVKENWFTTWEHRDNVINIAGIMKVHTNRQLIEFDNKIATHSNHFRLIEKAIEYTETPLAERGEVKKYRLKSYLDGNTKQGFVDDLIVCRNKACTRLYFLSNKDFKDARHIQTSFTQKEIDQMPFDTNFFIKEQV